MNRWWAVPLLTAAVTMTSCVGPARTTDDYARKARTTAEDVLSSVKTVRLAIELERHHRATHAYLSVVIGDAERDASEIQSTFDSIQPPNDRSDQVRDLIDDVVGEAVSQLGDARIAIRRDDRDGLLGLAGQLDGSATKLERISGHAG